MDDRGLDVPDLGALLRAHGPVTVFQAIEDACAQNAHDADDAELWECAATAAHDAAISILGDEHGEDDDGEDDELDADRAEDAVNDATNDAPTTTDVEPEPPQESAPTRTEETKTMARLDALGPRPSNATSWRATFRAHGSREWQKLKKRGEDGTAIVEWPIRTCSQHNIREMWPDLTGVIVVWYMGTDENGRRRPVSRSLEMDVCAPASPPAETEPARSDDEVTDAVAAAPARSVLRQAVTIPASQAAALPAFGAGAGEGMNLFTLLTFMEDRAEKARAIEASRQRSENERRAAEAHAALERQRMESEAQIERDRLASAERIAQIEANARAHGRGGHSSNFDAEAFVKRIETVVEERVQEALESVAAPEPMGMVPAAAAASGEPPAWVTKLMDMAQPLVPMLVTMLQKNGAEAASGAGATALRVVKGGAGGGDAAE